MKSDRRELHDWERAECLALKAEIAAHNDRAGVGQKLTQEYLAQEVGMTQGNLSSHLNGKRPLSKEVAAKLAILLGIPVEKFSPRLAQEIADMAKAVQPTGAEPAGDERPTTDKKLAIPPVARFIIWAANQGRLKVDDLSELYRMASYLASKNTEQNGAVELPANLDGLAEAALRAAENGDNPEDLLRMVGHGLKKSQPQEGQQSDGKRKARSS